MSKVTHWLQCGINSYLYAASNPTYYTDSSGRCTMRVGAVIGGLIGTVGVSFTNQHANWKVYAAAGKTGVVFGAVGTFFGGLAGSVIAGGAVAARPVV